MFGGWLSSSDSLESAAAELSATIGGFDIATAGAGHVLVVQGPTNSSGIRAFVERGGGVLYLAVGIGEGECVNGLDPATMDLPIRYSCEDPAPWGPVAALLPHPVTVGLGTDAVPFVNGRYVVEEPGAGSTVLAQP